MDLLNNTKQLIATNRRFLETLEYNIINRNDVSKWFKEMCDHLTDVILNLVQLQPLLSDKKHLRNTLMLYLYQIVTTLTLFIDVFVKESELGTVLQQARVFARKKMITCLDGIEDIILNKTSPSGEIGNFIVWMDTVLEKITEIDYVNNKEKCVEAFQDAKILSEEVLSHAMSIAQVALQEDYKIIRGASQTVLDSLESLSKEILSPTANPSMVSLFAESCSNRLCALERKVNIAVLKLCLDVFSKYTIYLEAIHEFCLCNSVEKKLDNLIMEFDLHVDRIMQIGLFAISCSTDNTVCVKIRSCLASLEALETELVPVFSAALLDNSEQNVQSALILEQHWLNEAAKLQKLIYTIIDPLAFCQVVHEENRNLVTALSKDIKMRINYIDKNAVKRFIDNSVVLQDFLKQITNTGSHKITDYKKMLHEVRAASNALLHNQEHESNFRVYKRCKILLECTKTLSTCFTDENASSGKINDDTVKVTTGNGFLDHIINRGKQILQDRSILYKSYNKTETFNVSTVALRKITRMQDRNKLVPISKLVHLRKLGFAHTSVSNVELQITDIVNELNNLTSTFA